MKILLAFTESQITDDLSKMLVDLGWPRPGVAHNSDDAVVWMNENGGCDLLISEVYFSPADGFTLRDTVAPFLPDMRILFSSKFDISPYADRLSGAPFLSQPLNPETLRKAVVDLIGEPRVEEPAPMPVVSAPVTEAQPAPTPEPKVQTPPPAASVQKTAEPETPASTKETKKKTPRKKSAKTEPEALPALEKGEAKPASPEPPVVKVATEAPVSPKALPSAPEPSKPVSSTPAPLPQPPHPTSAPPPLPTAVVTSKPATASLPPQPQQQKLPPAPADLVKGPTKPSPRIPTTTIKFEEPAQSKPTGFVKPGGPAPRAFAPTSPVPAVSPKNTAPVAKPALPPTPAATAAPPKPLVQTPPPPPQPSIKPAVASVAPKVVNVAVSPAAPQAKPTPSPAIKAKAGPVRAQLPPDDLVGTTLGNYEIQSLSAKFQTERLYRARQTNIERQVLLTVLDPESAKDSAVLERFLADSRAKARVSHTTIAAVYEGGSDKGFHFYSSEFAPVPTLAQIQAQGGTLKPLVALQIFKVVAEALAYFLKEGIAHQPLTAEAILLKPGGLPRLANIACGDSSSTPSDASEMEALGGFIHKSLPQSADSKPAREVAASLLRAADQPITWPEVAALAESKLPKAAPADAAKIQARDIAVSRAVGENRKKSRSRVIIGSSISLALTAAACFAIYYHLNSSSIIQVDDLGGMIEIPAGEFAYQDERKELPKFYISKYEVSIYEYKKFLDALAADPGLAARIAHPSQPPGKSHVPKGWADETQLEPPNPGYFNRARKWGQYQGAALSLDSPVFGVDWFDAYAYANWKGHKLPTEEQWEKVARGQQGWKYPWGDEEELKRANTGADFTANPDPKKGGEQDGFKRSSPVNQPASDKSPYGVVGLAGNVSEWTATLAEDPEMPGEQIPVIRGGNWKNPAGSASTRRVIKLDELMSDETLGFRTVSDGPPAQ